MYSRINSDIKYTVICCKYTIYIFTTVLVNCKETYRIITIKSFEREKSTIP